MINYQELGIDPYDIVAKQGFAIQLPPEVHQLDRKATKESAALGILIAELGPVALTLIRKEVMESEAQLNPKETLNLVVEKFKKAEFPHPYNSPEEAKLFVGGVVHGFIKAVSEPTYDLMTGQGKFGSAINLKAVAAMGIHWLHDLGVTRLNGQQPNIARTINTNPEAMRTYIPHLPILRPYAGVLAERFNEAIQNIPAGHVPSHFRSIDQSQSDTQSE